MRQELATDLCAHALLHEGSELALIVDLDQLLVPGGGVSDIELHDGETETIVRNSMVLGGGKAGAGISSCSVDDDGEFQFEV